MKTLIVEKRTCGEGLEAMRAAALEQLISLLEGGEPSGCAKEKESRIARLDGARAYHALAATHEMMRVSEGAWLKSRYN